MSDGEGVPRPKGAIFDIDGVLVDSPHEKAWRESLRELMDGPWRGIRDRTTWSPDAFTRTVYETRVSGKPRVSGARAVLEHFRIPDDDRESRVAEYADRKQAMVVRLIEAGDFQAYPDALRFIIWAKDAGMRIAAASSSKNVNLLLRKIRLDDFAREQRIESPSVRRRMALPDFFDVDVSGREFERGKPHPEMFLGAARGLGVAPEEAIVLEDAAAGVEAAKAGGMTAIGIARAGDADLLKAAGADIVVANLDDIDRDALAAGRLERVGAS